MAGIKFGLALGSGGSRGAAHVGFIKWLEENGLTPDLITGSSMGAVVGGCYALGMTTEEMCKEIDEFKMSYLVDPSVVALKSGSIMRTHKFKKTIDKYFKGRKFGDLKIPFRCVATDLVSGTTVVMGKDENDFLGVAVAASATIPMIFKPVAVGETVLVDGGLLCRVPVGQAYDMGAEKVIAVDVLGSLKKGKKTYNAITLSARTIEITDETIANYKRQEFPNAFYIEPDLGEMTQYDAKNLGRAVEAGYKAAKDNGTEIKRFLKTAV